MATGTYTLSVIELGANGASEADTDFPITTSTSGEVDVGGSVTGTVDRSFDTDWFRVELVEGKRYQIDLEGADTGRGTLADPHLYSGIDAGGNNISRHGERQTTVWETTPGSSSRRPRRHPLRADGGLAPGHRHLHAVGA